MGDRRERLWLLPAAVVAAFGPYLFGGIRAEQAAVYGLFVTGIILRPQRWAGPKHPGLLVAITAVWTLYLIAATFGALDAWPDELLSYPARSVISGADNLLLPLACIGVTITWVPPEHAHVILRRLCATTAVLGAANGALALVQTQVDLSPWLRPFWAATSDDGSLTTAEYALQLGRTTGVFGQPAEAGLMASIAAVAAVYVWRERPRFLLVVMTFIAVGGFTSVSKVFVLIGAPVAFWQVWRIRGAKPAIFTTIAAASLAAYQSGILESWDGLNYLLRLINPTSGSVVELYSAHRFGSASSLTGAYDAVARVDPMLGIGLQGLAVPYDNGLIEAFIMAGAVGVVCYVVTLLLLWRIPRNASGAERSLAYGIAVVATLASAGIPALTANRAGTIVWLLAATLIVVTAQRPANPPEAAASDPLTSEPPAGLLRGDRRVAVALHSRS